MQIGSRRLCLSREREPPQRDDGEVPYAPRQSRTMRNENGRTKGEYDRGNANSYRWIPTEIREQNSHTER
jgi:hypothetical protein